MENYMIQKMENYMIQKNENQYGYNHCVIEQEFARITRPTGLTLITRPTGLTVDL